MKKMLVVALAAGAFALAGCGPKEPAREQPVGEWSEVDDIGVRAWTAMNHFDVQVNINNHSSSQIDREEISLATIDGEHIDEQEARGEF